MPRVNSWLALTLGTLSLVYGQAASQPYSWKNVKIGGGGGFVPGIIFNPSEKVSKDVLVSKFK
jgi:xyloglucan-specific exo-beta-1,4-glucanase